MKLYRLNIWMNSKVNYLPFTFIFSEDTKVTKKSPKLQQTPQTQPNSNKVRLIKPITKGRRIIKM